MKATIEVKDRKEADAIRVGLEDPIVRAQVVVLGTLKQLPTERALRVLFFVKDLFEEQGREEARDGAK